jgi:hypothetical protein
MSSLSQGRFIDMLEHIDVSLLEEDGLERDLRNPVLSLEKREKWNKKKIAMISGIAAGSVAIAGAMVFLIRKNHGLRKIA